MNLMKILLIVIAFFLGLALLIHICSKNKYTLVYHSKKRKIKIHPNDESNPTLR